MSEYTKKTVADLQEILKSRGLASSGKKAELIARLTEADKAAESSEVVPAEPAIEPESAQPATVEAPQEESAVSDITTNDTTERPTGESAETVSLAAEPKTFVLNLAASDLDNELERRKKRAERFGGGTANADAETTENATADTEAQKLLERAKKFGTGQNALGKLDEALPSERVREPRGKNRGAAPVTESSPMDDPGLKKNFRGKGRFANRRRGGANKPQGVAKPSQTAYTSDKDREAAERRKQRFANAS